MKLFFCFFFHCRNLENNEKTNFVWCLCVVMASKVDRNTSQHHNNGFALWNPFYKIHLFFCPFPSLALILAFYNHTMLPLRNNINCQNRKLDISHPATGISDMKTAVLRRGRKRFARAHTHTHTDILRWSSSTERSLYRRPQKLCVTRTV